MCGHGVIAVTTIALERGLLDAGRRRRDGRVRHAGGNGARARGDAALDGQDASSACRSSNVPSFVLHGGLAVQLGSRQLRADVAFGGAFYAIVDSEAVGLPIDAAHLPELRRAGMEIARAVDDASTIVHPLEPALRASTARSSPGRRTTGDADLRNVDGLRRRRRSIDRRAAPGRPR